MKLKRFQYAKSTKSGIELSERIAIVLQPAKDYDHTVDITDVAMPMALDILAVELKKLDSEYSLKLKELLSEFGLESKIRNFKIDKMSNVEIEEI